MTTREKIRYTAIAVSLAYTIVRVLVVNASLSAYGVNPWVFLVIDGVAGVAYVLGVEQLIVALNPKTKAPWWRSFMWAAATAVAFAMPYLYIFMSSQELPLAFTIGLGVLILLLLANALVAIVRQLRGQKVK